MMLSENDDFTPTAAGLLLRVSSPGQAQDGASPETQEKVGRDVAAHLGIPVVGVYADLGVSGDLYLTRNGLQDALRDMKAGKFNLLIAYDLSRVTWSTEHQPAIFRAIYNAGGRLHVHLMGGIIEPTHNYQQEFFANTQTNSDRFYRRHTRANCMRGRRTVAAKGKQPCRVWSPYGFHIVRKADIIRGIHPAGTDGTYVIIEEQAAIIREVFDRFAAGESLRQIVLDLQARGVPPARKSWGPSGLRKMLGNRAYKGEATFGVVRAVRDESRIGQARPSGGTYTTSVSLVPAPASTVITIPCPVIVKPHVWEQAQMRMKKNKETLSGRRDRRYLLSGLLVCPVCLRSCRAKGPAGTSPGYYRCRCATPSWARDEKRDVCSPAGYNMERADRLTAQAVQALLTRRDLLTAAIDAYREEVEGATIGRASEIAERARLQKRLDDIAAKRAQLMAMELDAGFVAGALRDLSARWQEAQAALAAAPAVPALPVVPTVEQIERHVGTALVEAERVLMDERVDVMTRHQILRGLVETITPELDRTPGAKKLRHPVAVDVRFLPLFQGESVANSDLRGVTVHRISMTL